jgi:putative transcriptional regulator
MTKKKNKTYKSDALAAIHETASDYYDAGVIDKQTMRSFDASCLTPIHEFTAKEIRALREREQVSQTVFANHLNVSKDSVSQWERGEKHPAGPSLKLLTLVEKKGLPAIA